MAECGLINYNEAILYTKPIEKEETGIVACESILLTSSTKNSGSGRMEIGQYPLTVAGKELYKLLDISTSESVFLSFAKAAQRENNSLNLYARRIIQFENGIYTHDFSDLLQ